MQSVKQPFRGHTRPRVYVPLLLAGQSVEISVGMDGQVVASIPGAGVRSIAHSGDARRWLLANLPPSDERDSLIRCAGPKSDNQVGLSHRVMRHR